jgi:hypothetical protein
MYMNSSSTTSLHRSFVIIGNNVIPGGEVQIRYTRAEQVPRRSLAVLEGRKGSSNFFEIPFYFNFRLLSLAPGYVNDNTSPNRGFGMTAKLQR